MTSLVFTGTILALVHWRNVIRIMTVSLNIFIPALVLLTIRLLDPASQHMAALVKMVPGSWRDLGKIPPRFPPGSRRDFGRRDSRFPPGFLPGFLAGGGIPGGQNLGGIPAGILPGFLAGSGIPAAKISAGFRRESCRDSWWETGFSAAKISAGSRRESCRDSWRVTGYLGGSVARIFDGKQNSLRSKSSRQPKSPGVLSGILPGFVMRT